MALADQVFVGKRALADPPDVGIVLRHVDCYLPYERMVFFGASANGSVVLTEESFAEFLVAFERYLDRK